MQVENIQHHQQNSQQSLPPTRMDGDTAPSNKLNLKTVLYLQDWLAIIFTILLIIAAAVFNGVVGEPAARSFSLYDATISYPYKGSGTIPYWLVPIVGLVCFLLSVAFFEFFIARRIGVIPLTNMVASALFFFIEFVCAGVFTSLLTEITKSLVGWYRPEWLAKCQPAIPSNIEIAYGLPPSANPTCNPDASVTAAQIKDGHQSFISGHASVSFALSVYVSGYCLWAAHYRVEQRKYAPKNADRRTLKERMVGELGSTALIIWVLFNIAWAWGVSISRVVDNKHHPTDVVGGALLGTVVGVVFILRALSRHYSVLPEPGCSSEPLLEDDSTPVGMNA